MWSAGGSKGVRSIDEQVGLTCLMCKRELDRHENVFPFLIFGGLVFPLWKVCSVLMGYLVNVVAKAVARRHLLVIRMCGCAMHVIFWKSFSDGKLPYKRFGCVKNCQATVVYVVYVSGLCTLYVAPPHATLEHTRPVCEVTELADSQKRYLCVGIDVGLFAVRESIRTLGTSPRRTRRLN